MSVSSLEDVGSHLNIQRGPHFTSICCFGFEELLPSRLTAPILTSASIMSPQSPARRSAAGGLTSPQRSASRSWRWKLCPGHKFGPLLLPPHHHPTTLKCYCEALPHRDLLAAIP